jgi:hypothetical protein
MKGLAVVIALLSPPAIAQMNIAAHLGLSGPVPGLAKSSQSSFLDRYWSEGIDVSLDGEYRLSDKVWVACCAQYTYYRWDNFKYSGAWIPEWRIRSSSGQDSKIYRAALEMRLLASRKFLVFDANLYLITGVGYAIENIGRIRAIIDDMNGPGFILDVGYPNRSYWNHSLGIGVRANIFGSIAMDLTAKYFTDYSERFYTAYTGGIAYAIGR